MPQNGCLTDRAIVFDGDDTLWATQELYDEAKAQFFRLLGELGYNRDGVTAKFSEIDVANVARLGLSRERFPTSMRETYEFFCRESGTKPESEITARALALGNAVFDSIPVVRPDAVRVLDRLRARYRLVLFTAGDEAVQRCRIEQTRLGTYFDAVQITPQKTPETWGALLRLVGLHARSTWSVGNSVRSDINPALHLGLRCVVVAGRTWAYEQVALAEPPDGARVWHTTTLKQAARVILDADSFWTDAAELPEPLVRQLQALRHRLEPAFARDTAVPGARGTTPSAGHCAVVAAIVQQHLGGEMVSTKVEGESHWFNRLSTGAGPMDVDLTGDQFGWPPIQVAPAGELYTPVTVRPFAHLLPETLDRAARLAARAALQDLAQIFQRAYKEATGRSAEDTASSRGARS